MIIGSRIPKEYVRVKGAGQATFGPGIDPWETAAYDIALLNAGIENCNIVAYTSVIPPEAEEIPLQLAIDSGYLHHGMVLECIKSQVNGNQGDHICAGVGTCHVYQRKCLGIGTRSELVHIGGFAAEYEGHGSPERAKDALEEALDGIVERRYGRNPDYVIKDHEYTIQDLIVDDDYGCVVVALGFVRFVVLDYDK